MKRSDFVLLDNTEEVIQKVLTLIEDSGMSYEELSAKSGVPVSSIKRYIKGETKSPGFFPLCSVITALGGSVDEIIGLNPQSVQIKPRNDEITKLLHSDLKYERKLKERWQILFLILVLINIGILVVDILNPSIGYVRYAQQMAAAYSVDKTSFIFCCI